MLRSAPPSRHWVQHGCARTFHRSHSQCVQAFSSLRSCKNDILSKTSITCLSFFFFHQRAFPKHFIIVSRALLLFCWILLWACLMADVMSEYRSADLQNCWQRHIEFFQLLADGHQRQKWPWMNFNKLFNSMFQSFDELIHILRESCGSYQSFYTLYRYQEGFLGLLNHRFLLSMKEQQSLLRGNKRPHCSLSPLAALKHNRRRNACRSLGFSTFSTRGPWPWATASMAVDGRASTHSGGVGQLQSDVWQRRAATVWKRADCAEKTSCTVKEEEWGGFFQQNTCLRVIGESPHAPQAELGFSKRMKNADIAAKQWPPECNCMYVCWLFYQWAKMQWSQKVFGAQAILLHQLKHLPHPPPPFGAVKHLCAHCFSEDFINVPIFLQKRGRLKH